MFPYRYAQIYALALLLLGVAFQPQRLAAQGYGSIVGTVLDPTGASVPGAKVLAIQTDNGRKTTVESGQTGAFVFPTLAPSGYSLSVTAKGFEAYQQTGVVLQANQALTFNVKLVIGAATETVEVTSSIPQVDTTTGTLSQVIDQQRVVDLPLNGRNAAALITLVAGVVDASSEGNGADQGSGKTFPVAVVTSANGTLPNQSNYLLDGGNNVDEMTNVNAPFPFPDALQEFSVQTSNYNAEFGQSAGAVVNIVTKSGGTAFHGDAFEFLRNGYFNAKPYFATTPDTLHRHQFGGTIGGPVIIPHFSTGTRTQFFFGYQHQLYHASSTTGTTTVPTLAEEGRAPGISYADFGNLCNTAVGNSFNGSGVCVNSAGSPVPAQQITNPFTNVAYANNRIPASDFDPASVAYEKVFPTYSGAEAPGVIGAPVHFSQPTVRTFNEYVARVDHTFGDKDHLFGRYFYDYYQQDAVFDPAMLASYRSYFNTRYQNALLSEQHTFSSSVVNNLVLNYQREVALRGGPPGSPTITSFGVKNLWQPTTGPYLSASISNYFGATSSAFAGWLRNNYTFNDDLHWVKGSHNITFGGHIELSKFDVTNVFQSYGGFGFNAVSQKIGTTTYQYPNAMANFQLGFMSSFSQGNYELLNDRNHFPGIYAQDSWKVSSQLTLNYGVRWEEFAPWANRVGQQTAFNPSNYAANKGTSAFPALPAGFMLTGDPGMAPNGVYNKYAQFMPRVGFAFDVLGDGRTVVRGGTGIFYQDRMPGFFNLNQAGNVPNTVSVGLSNLGMYGTTPGVNPGGPFSNPYCTGCAAGVYPNPFPFTLPFASSHVFPNGILLDEDDPSGNFKVPVTYDYNLTIEHQLASSWAMRLAYVGSGSRHQFVNLEINPAVNNGSGLSANSRRVYNTAPTVGPCSTATGCSANYAQIVLASMSGNAHYNSFQATLDKKMSHGLSLLANWTWSKSYDDMPQATRVGNTEDLNAGASYVYPFYPAGATGIPATAYVPDIKALDRGLSDIDHPHAISISYVYELPKLHSGFRVAQAVANGWRTSGLIQHHSGESLSAWVGSDNSQTGLGQDRAQRDFTQSAYLDQPGGGHCVAGKSCVNWLNPAAFSIPAQTGVGTGFGNVMKGSLRGPGYTNWDASVVRSFPIFRESTMEFRAEYFNLVNHTKLGNPSVSNPSVGSTFGTITATNPSTDSQRIAQFSLKYLF
ncbi:MAG: TonB-dependent receptor [Acidobacteriota bacterium]|nr:TonB-dependent receptor [Acidobacteriota bacterium]